MRQGFVGVFAAVVGERREQLYGALSVMSTMSLTTQALNALK
jgi:hypothetical protein